jgi:hypothetical protein
VRKNFAVLRQFFVGYLCPPPKSKYQSWYLTPCGLEVQNPTQALKSVKGPGNTFHLNPSGKEFIHPLAIFRGILKGSTPSKYQSRYLTPCCGIEAQSPTHALTLVKGPSNAFDLTPKWERTLPSFGNFPWDIERVHPIQISKLIFDTLLSAWGAGSHPGT